MRNLRVLVNQPWAVHAAVLLKMPLVTMKPSRQRSATFPSFLLDAEEQIFQTFEVIMIEPANG